MKIINRYVLKEHFGPFVFALSALTSLLLLQYIARRFGDLVGKGLSWQVITEFFLLSIPFTVAMTLPMAVLVSVLYAFSRLASENEVTALKAGGVSTRSLMRPALVASVFLAVFMLWFNDQLLPRANHELATLQLAIIRTKPTFALKPQVINTVKESQLYLRAGGIDQDQSGRMTDVTIYDLSDQPNRKTIYAAYGTLAFAENHRDLIMELHNGYMLSSPTAQPDRLNRVYFERNQMKIRDVANQFQSINADSSAKGEREMSVCEMQKEYEAANARVHGALEDSLRTVWRLKENRPGAPTQPPKSAPVQKRGGIGAVYCNFITKYFHVKEAAAAELPHHAPRVAALQAQDASKHQQPDTTKKKAAPAPQGDSVMVIVDGNFVKVSRNHIPPNAVYADGSPAGADAIKAAADSAKLHPTPPRNAPVVVPPAGTAITPTPGVVPNAVPNAAVPNPANAHPGATPTPVVAAGEPPGAVNPAPPELADAHFRLDEARHSRNRYGVEIQKKFSLAAACIVFVLVGAPIALRFPRGGVGLVIGVSFVVFAVYYVGLIGGESLANKNIVSPFWAMWINNILFLVVGLVLIARMGNEGVTGRGGNVGEIVDTARAWFARRAERRTQPEVQETRAA